MLTPCSPKYPASIFDLLPDIIASLICSFDSHVIVHKQVAYSHTRKYPDGSCAYVALPGPGEPPKRTIRRKKPTLNKLCLKKTHERDTFRKRSGSELQIIN